jgi:hypothetical protein
VKTKRVREVFSSDENEIHSVDVSPDGELLYYSVYWSRKAIHRLPQLPPNSCLRWAARRIENMMIVKVGLEIPADGNTEAPAT